MRLWGFWDNPKHPHNSKLGKGLGILHHVDAPQTIHIIKSNGQVESRFTLQHVTELDLCNPETKSKIEEFREDLNEKLNEQNI